MAELWVSAYASGFMFSSALSIIATLSYQAVRGESSELVVFFLHRTFILCVWEWDQGIKLRLSGVVEKLALSLAFCLKDP